MQIDLISLRCNCMVENLLNVPAKFKAAILLWISKQPQLRLQLGLLKCWSDHITHPQKRSIASLCSSTGPLTGGTSPGSWVATCLPCSPHTVLLSSLYLPGCLPPAHLHSLGLGNAHLFTQVTPIVSAIRGSRITSLASPARPRPPTAHTLGSRHPSFLTSVTVTVTHLFICVAV